MVEKNIISSSEHRIVKKIGNKMIEILAKPKSWSLLKFQFKHLPRFKNVQSISIIEEPNFLTFNAKVIFTKLKYIFT